MSQHSLLPGSSIALPLFLPVAARASTYKAVQNIRLILGDGLPTSDKAHILQDKVALRVQSTSHPVDRGFAIPEKARALFLTRLYLD